MSSHGGVLAISALLILSHCKGLEEYHADDARVDAQTDTPATDEIDVPDEDLDPSWDMSELPPEDSPADTGFDLDAGDTLDTGADTALDPPFDTAADTSTDPGIDPIPDLPADLCFDPAYDPGIWGTPVCRTGTTISDTGSYVDTAVVPSPGTFLVMQLDIAIPDRSLMGIELSFSDLVISLTSPGGVEHVFWSNFLSDDTGSLFPDYAFPSTWLIPVWWCSSCGGTWTLSIDDTSMTMVTTTLTSWCLTPLDPTLHASAPIASRLNHVATDTGSITDCDLTEPMCPGRSRFETQVTDIIISTGTPVLEVTLSHPDWSQLRIVLTGADGTQETVWDRGTGSPPSTFPVYGMAGAWMTGRYQLLVEDHVSGSTGSLTRWAITAN
jgi:subtilisin-like proprotein convertase family protein